MMRFLLALLLVVALSSVCQQDLRAEELPAYVPESSEYAIEPPDVLLVTLNDVEIVSGGSHLKATAIQWQGLVGPDGRVKISQFGSVHVAGMTKAQAARAIKRDLAKAKGQDQIAFKDISVEVAEANSKVVYLIHRTALGDNIARMPLKAPMTVRDLLANATWTHPVHFADCQIELRRPQSNQSESEVTMAIKWDANKQDSDATINQQLLPGDRVFVAERGAEKVKPAQAISSAVPPTPVEATGYYQASPEQAAGRVPQIQYKLKLIEDSGDNLAELGKPDAEIFNVDTKSTLGILRILEKNELITVLAAPTLVTKLGGTVRMEVGEPLAGKTKSFRNAMNLEVKSATRGELTQVDLKFQVTRNGQPIDMDISLLIDKGETVILKMSGDNDEAGSKKTYLVVTTELVE